MSDTARFLHLWSRRPLMTGAVAPSGKALSRAMAREIDPSLPGPVIEIGPGTGPVTEALIEHGVPARRLVLVEYDRDLVRLLRRRFPEARVIQGDAYRLDAVLAGVLEAPAAGVVSSLPLVVRPVAERLALLEAAFGLMRPGAPFVQFTYAAVSPIPPGHAGIVSRASPRIWRNVPPARVWVYSRGASR